MEGMKSLRCLLILSLERFIFIFITFIIAVGSKTMLTTATITAKKKWHQQQQRHQQLWNDNKGKFCADARDSYHEPPLVIYFVGVRPLVCHCDLQQTFEYK